MIFVEFLSSNYPTPGAKHHFVGASLQDVLDDTNGGKKFGCAEFLSHREISFEEARQLGLEFFDKGIEAIREGTSKSYMLGTTR